MSEQEFRQGGAEAIGVTINVAFLQEIKEDFEFRQLLNRVQEKMNSAELPKPREASEMLHELRDELETYFTLEECYGYFQQAAVSNPAVSIKAADLQSDHERLFLQFNAIVEMSEQIVYRECSDEITVANLSADLAAFCTKLTAHEQNEMELMMRMCNEDIGVGD
jgi:iron-sulfur cluster repair protein YtfE (RIC family)